MARRGLQTQPQVFLLSPAQCGGPRASLLTREQAAFDLARELRQPAGAALGDVFSFLSGLYFRGKLAYARHFARPPRDAAGVLVITPDRGLRTPEERLTVNDLRAMAAVPIRPGDALYEEPLRRDLAQLAGALPRRTSVVFLGSIATAKYLGPLRDSFAERLVVPADFAGRGDMSRGGMLLRAVREARELVYVRAPELGPPRRRRTP